MTRGQLNIFLGYAGGVGTTNAMLKAACRRRAQGVDVAAVLVDTHGFQESEELLLCFERAPVRNQPGPEGDWKAIDVEAVLVRRPALALVDDIALLNPPGGRHARRYQDVEELLESGMDVYATLCIQNISSLVDVVRQITGIEVTDTVPNSLLDQANEIQIVDLPPTELFQLFREGKVYIPERLRPTSQNLYRIGNLTALRELALRRAAERADDQMRAYMQTKSIPGPWPAGERLLVCVSANPLGERLVRAARRLADDLNAPWYAVHVETPGPDRRPPSRERIFNTLQLAESLGGQAVMLAGRAVAPAVVEFARKNNITKVIVGKPLRPRWVDFLRGAMIDQIIRQSGMVDVYMISGETQPGPSGLGEGFWPHRPFWRYLVALLLVVASTLVGVWALNYLDPTSLVFFYLLAVVAAAIYLGRGPSILASLLSLLAYEVFYIYPHFGVALRDFQHLLTFSGLLLVGWMLSNLAAIARDQVSASQRREAHTAAISLLSRELTEALNLDGVLRVMMQRISQTFGREVVIFLPENDTLQLKASTANFQLDAEELSVIHWAYQRGETAGRSTGTLPQTRLRAIPLVTSRGIVGVLGVIPPDPASYLDPDQRRLLTSFANLCALALERSILADQAGQTQVLQAADRLQTALLNSISHDLRTPLASITGVLSSLKEAGTQGEEGFTMDPATQVELVETALEEAGRLNRLVANLLDMSRLEAGALRLKREPCDLADVVGAALSHLGERLGKRVVQVNMAEDLPMVNLDFVMMNQVLVNVLDNAVKYSPPGTPITVAASLQVDGIWLSIADEGIGIPPEDLERVFNKFYRVQRPDGVSGTGLGLSICKGIVEAHDGRIWAENRAEGGTVIKIVLPVS